MRPHSQGTAWPNWRKDLSGLGLSVPLGPGLPGLTLLVMPER